MNRAAPRKPTRAVARPEVALTGLVPGFPGDLGEHAFAEDLHLAGLKGERVSVAHGRVLGCRFELPVVEELDLQGTTVRESELLSPAIITVRASRGDWSDVRVSRGRIGVLEAYESTWRTVELHGVRVSYLNLRAATIADLTLTDCRIDELDLAGARVERASLSGAQIGRLTVQGASLAEVDLRGASIDEVVGVQGLAGAIISSGQLFELAPALARAGGIAVRD